MNRSRFCGEHVLIQTAMQEYPFEGIIKRVTREPGDALFYELEMEDGIIFISTESVDFISMAKKPKKKKRQSKDNVVFLDSHLKIVE